MAGPSLNSTKVIPGNASFGFTFRIVGNGGGFGTAPKAYDPTIVGNDNLLGFTDDNTAGVTLLWASDPGDNSPPPVGAPGSRVYDPAPPFTALSPNNIRLSQVALNSLRASYGIRSTPKAAMLPTSFGFNRSLSLAQAADDIVGDIGGIRRITVSLLTPIPPGFFVLCNGSIPLNDFMPSFTFHLNNLGAVTVVNQTGAPAIIGVHCEINL